MDKVLVPLSIILAGVIVAGSILVTGEKINLPPAFGLISNKVDQNTLGTKKGSATAANGAPGQLGALQNPPALATEPKNFELGSNPIQGSESAKVSIVEFGDYQCPYCGRFYKEVLSKLKSDFVAKGLARFAYRDLAFLGQESKDAALASRCAGDQGKFWQYHDKLYNSQNGENQGAFKVANLKSFAKGLGLNAAEFNSCFDSRRHDPAVVSDMNDAQSYSVNSTPTVFINGKLFDSRYGYDNLYSTIETELKK